MWFMRANAMRERLSCICVPSPQSTIKSLPRISTICDDVLCLGLGVAELTLSLNLSQCPNRCPGCHSPQLQDDIGFPLDDGLLDGLLERYGNDVTCVCFMGGDREPAEVMRLAGHVHSRGLKTAWYSGKQRLPDCFRTDVLDYVKVGPYIESKGPLPSPDTNIIWNPV